MDKPLEFLTNLLFFLSTFTWSGSMNFEIWGFELEFYRNISRILRENSRHNWPELWIFKVYSSTVTHLSFSTCPAGQICLIPTPFSFPKVIQILADGAKHANRAGLHREVLQERWEPSIAAQQQGWRLSLNLVFDVDQHLIDQHSC